MYTMRLDRKNVCECRTMVVLEMSSDEFEICKGLLALPCKCFMIQQFLQLENLSQNMQGLAGALVRDIPWVTKCHVSSLDVLETKQHYVLRSTLDEIHLICNARFLFTLHFDELRVFMFLFRQKQIFK